MEKRFALVLSYRGVEKELSYHETYDEANDAYIEESQSDPLPNYWIKELTSGTEDEKIETIDNLVFMKNCLVHFEEFQNKKEIKREMITKLNKTINELKNMWDFL